MKPKAPEKNLYLLSRIRFLEDRCVMLEANLGRLGDFLGYVAQMAQEHELLLKPPVEPPAATEPTGDVTASDLPEQPTLTLVP